MTGWGVWLLLLSLTIFTGGTIFVPVVGGFLTFAYGDFMLGLLMLTFGTALGLALAHLLSIVLRLPGAYILRWISNQPGNQDLQINAR